MAFKRPFGFQPLEQQLAQREAELRDRPVQRGAYFDHPTARYVFISLLILVAVLHFGALIVLGLMGIH